MKERLGSCNKCLRKAEQAPPSSYTRSARIKTTVVADTAIDAEILKDLPAWTDICNFMAFPCCAVTAGLRDRLIRVASLISSFRRSVLVSQFRRVIDCRLALQLGAPGAIEEGSGFRVLGWPAARKRSEADCTLSAMELLRKI